MSPRAPTSSTTSPALSVSDSVPPPGVAATPAPAAMPGAAEEATPMETCVPSCVAVIAKPPGESLSWSGGYALPYVVAVRPSRR